MNVAKAYITEIASAENVFDMAAVCYKLLENTIANPPVFISQYVDESDEETSPEDKNPNYKCLRSFSEWVGKRLEKYSEYDFPKQKRDIVDMIRQMRLADFLEEDKNQLSVVFTLLSTIDGLVPLWTEKGIMGKNPLNKGSKMKDYYVYLTCKECIHEALIQEIGRERKTNGDFGETLNNLLFIKKGKLPNGAMPPEIYSLTRETDECLTSVTVAIITGLTGVHFKQSSMQGSIKIIEYVQEAQIKLAEKIWSKMRQAIRRGAEFIILPEFCVSEEIWKYISEKLLAYRHEEKVRSKLIAVFPGSTWIETNDNVQFIMDAWGRKKGQYYKNTVYRKRKKDASGYQVCEGVTHLV